MNEVHLHFILLEHTMIWFLFKGDFILIWLDEIYMNFQPDFQTINLLILVCCSSL